MEFPSREEARVYVSLRHEAGPPASAAPPPAAATPDPALGDSTATSTKVYRVDKKGFENDTFDRRAVRSLIRTGGLLESDPVSAGEDPPRRAADFPELKSLFDLKKTSRIQPPTVCRKHTDQLAHYVCADTGRPLCEDCAAEKKFGGASVRVCDHCGGTVNETAVGEGV